jgi:hypothetical protein
LQYARQTNNLYELAYMFGYKPNVTGVALTDISFYQQVPASGSFPDFNYALYIEPNARVISSLDSSISFLIEDPIDFSVSSSSDPTEVTIYQSTAGVPNYFLLKKNRKAISANINSKTYTFSQPNQFTTIGLNDSKIIGILDCFDSDSNQWYEVDYLAQDTIYKSIRNTNTNDPYLSQYQGDTPYLLQLEQVQRRFVTRFLDSGSMAIQFGAGTATDKDEKIIPNPDNVGLGLPFEKDRLTVAYSPNNFTFTRTYGIAPSNTTLTFRYLTGGGVTANVPSNDLTTLNATTKFINSNLNATTANTIFNTLAVTNPIAASGGGDGDTSEEIRQNSSANFASQQRTVTQDDYLVRTLAMPSKYGTVAKAYIEPTKAQTISAGESNSILDLYVLSNDAQGKLTTASPALKQNIITYLSQYRMVNDSINIKDGFIINIGVNFDIIVLPNYNNNDVLIASILALQDYFRINNWQINQPIILRNLYAILDRIEGIQTVKNIEIVNKVGINLGYSPYAYDITGATANNVIYPSLDPSIFEVKYLDTDIQGKVVPL